MPIVAPVAPSAVTPLPTPPSTSDPTNFDARADAFLGGLLTFQTQHNALAQNVFDNATKTVANANEAATSADNSNTSAAAALASQNAAAASAAAALVSQNAAATSATNASNSASASATSATDSQNYSNDSKAYRDQTYTFGGELLTATSTTSFTPAIGSITITIETNKGFGVGSQLKVISTVASADYIVGAVTAYNRATGSLTINATEAAGTTARNSWTLVLVAPGGASLGGNNTFSGTNTFNGITALKNKTSIVATTASTAGASDCHLFVSNTNASADMAWGMVRLHSTATAATHRTFLVASDTEDLFSIAGDGQINIFKMANFNSQAYVSGANSRLTVWNSAKNAYGGIAAEHIELSGPTPNLDFHYASNNGVDYTSRIIADRANGCSFYGGGLWYFQGDIGVSGTFYGFYTSDPKFKENVKPITSALDTSIDLGGYFFDWKDSYLESLSEDTRALMQKRDVGFMADVVQKYYPSAVTMKLNGGLGVDYQRLVPHVNAAVVEVGLDHRNTKAKLEAAEQRIADLETKVEKLMELLNK